MEGIIPATSRKTDSELMVEMSYKDVGKEDVYKKKHRLARRNHQHRSVPMCRKRWNRIRYESADPRISNRRQRLVPLKRSPRNKKDYYVSFIGFTPVEKPELLVYVTIDEPNVSFQANAGLAVGLEKSCMEEIVNVLGIKAATSTKE